MTLIQDINMFDFLIDDEGISEQKDDTGNINSLWKSAQINNYVDSFYEDNMQDMVPMENNSWDDILSCLNSEEAPAAPSLDFDLLSEVCESDGSSDLNVMSPSDSDDSGVNCNDMQDVVNSETEVKLESVLAKSETAEPSSAELPDRLHAVSVQKDKESVVKPTVSKVQNTNQKSVFTKVYKVASAQPLILPVSAIKGIKAIKVINASSSAVPAATAETAVKTEHRHYPQLKLTDEEKRLMKKEGINLPENYPLTREEEKDLKRIRRKIRNKISAQDSRKRKKEYLDGLEDRMKRCNDENVKLKQRVKLLENNNQTLVGQLRKLQQIVTNATNTTQTSTAMLVLLLSFCLILLPNLKPGGKDNRLAQMHHFINTVPGRTLLSNALMGDMSQQCNPNEMPVKEEVEEVTEQQAAPSAEVPFRAVKRELEAWGDHDYLELPAKIPRKENLKSKNFSKEVKEDSFVEVDWGLTGDNKEQTNVIIDGTWDVPEAGEANKTKRVISVAYAK